MVKVKMLKTIGDLPFEKDKIYDMNKSSAAHYIGRGVAEYIDTPKPEAELIEKISKEKKLSDKEIKFILKQIATQDAMAQEDALAMLKRKSKYSKKTLERMLKSYEPKEEKKTKEEKETIIETSMINENGILYEQIMDEKCNVKFVSFEGKEVKYYDGIGREDATYMPINDDSLKEGAVLLPQKIEMIETIDTLAKEIRAHIHKYLDISEDFEIFSTYYILLSWIYDRISTLPYLRALGDTGSGKSRFLDVVGRLCYKPCMVSGSITPAPIYRMIRKWHGTLIIDEADFKDSSEKAEVITILNCGFERGRPVIRCDKDDPDNLQFLPTFSPKVIATRRTFYDKALESRCLTEILRQTEREDIPPLLPKVFYEEEMTLRNKLLYFRFIYRDKIDDSDIQRIDLGKIEPRLKQATASFAVLFVNIPELFDKFKEFLKKYQKDLIEERSTTPEGMIINALFDLLGVSTVSTISTTIGDPQVDTPHMIMISSKDLSIKLEKDGYEIKPQSIGMRLKSLGFKSFFVRKEKKRVIDTSDIRLLTSLFKRYSMYQLQKSPIKVDTVDTVDTKDTIPYAIFKEKIGERIIEILSEYKDGLSVNKLVSFFIEQDPKKIEEIIESMKKHSILFEPHPGHVKLL